MASFNTPGRTSPIVRIAYAQGLFNPKPYEAGGTPKYTCTIMFPKDSTPHVNFLKELHADLNACLVGEWPDEMNRPKPKLMGADRSPIKDGDAVNTQGILFTAKNPELKGHYFIRLSSSRKPTLIDAGRQEILDTNRLYSGCYVKANLNAYAFNMSTNKGVTFGLNAVQFIKDGESLGGAGQVNIDEAFADETSGANDRKNYQPVEGDDNPFVQPGANPLS